MEFIKGVSSLEGGHIHCIGSGRMLQLGVPKMYGGSSMCVKHANSRGVWENDPPRKSLKIMCHRLNLEAFSVVLAVNQILILLILF